MKPRVITKEIFNRLDSVEKIIASKYITEGRWILKEGDL